MNCLVVGLGSAGQRHLRVLHKFFGSKAKIFVYKGDHNRGLISDDLSSENFSINPTDYYHAEEVPVMGELLGKIWDLVIIATPPDSHYFYVELLIKSSMRILIEKPLTIDPDEAVKIANLAEHNDIPILVGYQLAYHPLNTFIQENINSIGYIESCATVFKEDLFSMNPFRSMDNHYLSKPTGGGAFLSLSHDLDFMLRTFNQTFAQNVVFIGTKFSNNQSLVECTLNCDIQFQSHTINLISEFSILPNPTCRNGKIRGTNGYIEWDFVKGEISLIVHSKQPRKKLSFLANKDELFKHQIEYLLSLHNYNANCQLNLSRAKFIVEANTKIT
jgi:predicted dehydrogenase